MKKKFFGIGKIALGLAASIGLGWLTARGLDWSIVFDALEGTSLALLILAVVIFMFASYLRAFRWDGKALTPEFAIDFKAEKLGRPHQMRFGARALYGIKVAQPSDPASRSAP